MFNIEFYENQNGESEVLDFLIQLASKAPKNKNARIQHKQMVLYIQLLADHGTLLGDNITKHIEDNIWELRPGKNRVLFFYMEEDTFLLLHHFRKKTQKTPKREITKAKHERDDWLLRKGLNKK